MSAQRGKTHLIDTVTKNKVYTYNIHINNEFETTIHRMLEPLYNNNPLKLFDKTPRYFSLELLE